MTLTVLSYLCTIGEIESAQTIVQRCIDHDGSSVEAHLLMAQIYLHQNNPKLCSGALEQALSSNFEVSAHINYYLLPSVNYDHEHKISMFLA